MTIALGASLWVAGLACPELFLVVQTPGSQLPATVGAVVVLGGEPWTRPARAAEVYQEIITAKQKAESRKQKLESPTTDHGPRTTDPFQLSTFPISALPLVVVSGNGDCQDVRRQMEAKGVPASAITTECASKSTQENALFSVKLLRERGVTNAVIVTSWYHSRRSLACFRKAAPEIHFSSRPTVRPPQKTWWPDKYERQRITQEYTKIVYYWLVYGVSPWQ